MSRQSGRRLPVLVALTTLSALLAVSGCLGVRMPDKQRFVLDPERPASRGARCDCKLHVGHIRVSPLFERKGFVYRTGEAAYSNDFYHEFHAPPGILLRGVLVDWLEEAGLFEAIVEPRDAGEAKWILEGQVKKLYGDFRDASVAKAVLEIEFTLLEVQAGQLHSAFRKTYGASARAAARHPEAVAEAWNEATARVFEQLEADLRLQIGLAKIPR